MKIVKIMLTILMTTLIVFLTAGSAFAGANIAISLSPTSADIGQEVTMTVVITNTGPGDLSNVNVSAPLPAGLKFLTSATGTTKNQYNNVTGLWQVDNLKMTSQGGGKKTLTVTAEVLPEASGKTLTATAAFLSVQNSSGSLPLKSAQSTITINSIKTNTSTGGETGNTGSTTSKNTLAHINAHTIPVSKTSLVAAKLNDNGTNSNNPLNLPQQNPGKAYDVYNSTGDNTKVPMSTYAMVALVGIGVVIVVGYYVGTRKTI
ncbi:MULTISPECIES: hypothetical protein [unclassified Methanobacterium]|jgi:uncharacterized repeat protein (TIGR01451 family)|uniref:hypothetical protein n=1 Tax=unclassified Methanobacterium TaxID=2627676 RepID=UPI000749E581|nr:MULTISPECIES: hypothetical protein [unclassified Methanobacterium]KUK73262.1 MAG: Uncharacterized protein XD90_1583 [Methanobacterium sp. 42_16]MDI3549049.1 hypothetical protein [Methanobacterium sp.]